jgi:hypothetical protein
LVGGEEEEGCEEHPTDEGDEGHGCSTRGRGGGGGAPRGDLGE